MRLRYTSTAYEKLQAIWSQLFEVNPFAAARMRKQLTQSLGRLRSFPRLGPQVSEYSSASVRQTIVGPYRFFYYVDERAQTIWIVDVWHGAQLTSAPELPQHLAE